MFSYCMCTQYLVGAPFALIAASIRRGMEVISLYIYIYVYVCVCVCVYIYIYVCVCIYIYVCVYI